MATRLAPPAARLLHKMAARGDGGGKVPRVLVAPCGARRPDGAFFCVKFVFQSRSIHVHDQKARLPLLAQHLVLHVTVLIN